MFMSLTAARLHIHDEDETEEPFQINTTWMHLAGQAMLIAALERVLGFGADIADAVRESFCWGYCRTSSDDGNEDIEAANALFCDVDDESRGESEEWAEIRNLWLHKLRPDGAQPISEHLARLVRQYPMKDFEDSMLLYLDALLHSVSLPVLLQLEMGETEELTKDDVVRLKQNVGWSNT